VSVSPGARTPSASSFGKIRRVLITNFQTTSARTGSDSELPGTQGLRRFRSELTIAGFWSKVQSIFRDRVIVESFVKSLLR